MVTSRDVARVAGVSQTTVSRVLHESPLVSEETRNRVGRALAETGYAPNAAARAMRTHRVGTIGVVVSRITNPFYPRLIVLLGRRLSAGGLRMTLWDGEDPGEDSAVDAIRQGLVDGLIFTTATEGSKALSEALQRSNPVVLLNRIVEGLPCDQVSSQNRLSGENVAKYLLGLGHRTMGYVAGPRNASTSEERRAGFTAIVESAGGSVDVSEGDFSHEHGKLAVNRWFAAAAAAAADDDGAPPKPTAVFCANDVIALGVIDQSRRLGIAVPRELAVVGHDDIEMAEWSVFDLTSVRQPLEKMVDAAYDLLFDRIRDGSLPPRHLRFASELIVRGSTVR